MIKKKTALKNLMVAGSLFAAINFTSCKKNIETSPAETLSISSEANLINNNDQEFVPNELLVRFKADVSDDTKNKLLSRISARVSEKILTKTMQRQNDKEGVLLLHTPLAVLEAKNKMNDASVVFAEPNYIYQHDAVSTDPYFTNGSLWGMSGVYGCRANEAWGAGHTGLRSVYIGIIDEGVMGTHADLAGNMWTNPFEVPNDGIDNDGNGYKDDVNGWDFDANNNTTFDGTVDDHGTHVAGTIGARANGNGVVGVNWAITMIPAKFLGRKGGTTANAIKAVDYITDLKTRHGLNIAATNNSWGGGGFSQALKDAIDRANAQNILFVAAAGNGGRDGVGDNNDATASYPSNYTSPNIITVAAITSTGAKAAYSNYGEQTVDLGAPGSGIYSTVPGRNNTSSYASYSGTSMATPHVSGAVALYAAYHAGSSASAIKTEIMRTVIATSSLNGKTVSGGRLNVGGF